MESDGADNPGALNIPPRPEEGPSALNSTILDYYKKFGRKRDLEQYFSLSTAQGDVRDPSSLFWRRMKSQSDSESGERSRESSTEICRISIKCSLPETSGSQDENTQPEEEKSDSVSPPIITEYVEEGLNISRQSDNESIKFDDNQSQKSLDVTLDTSLNKPPSPTSSITSQRRLEWDSLADVGYANESDKKTSASSLSTLERLALKQQYSNNDTKQSTDIGLPTAHSTPVDPNEPKTKNASKTTKIYRRDVDLVEVNIPESSNVNSAPSISVNLTKHISFNMEKDGGITVDNMRKNLSVIPEKVLVEPAAIPQVTDKEIQTSLIREKEVSSSSVDVPGVGHMYGQSVPVLINLNALRRRNRRKKVTTVRKKPRIKKRSEANKENLPFREKSGDPVSEAESFEYMPGHIYNQNKINRDETKPNQSAGNKSSLESSGVVTTDSSKDSKKSFTQDLEKSINLLKGALKKRYNDSNLKERLIKEVVQRLLKANYRDEESTTEFLSGLSFSSKKIGLTTEDPTTSTSDPNNTAEEAKSSRPKKSILRSDKFKTGAIASTSQSAPNLATMSNNEPIISSFAKTLLTSNTESDVSSKDKTSSEELYQKYLDALKKEEAYKKHLREKEMLLKQKRVCSDATFNFPTQLDVKSQNNIKNIMKDLTRNNYDDGSGDASKLEGGPSSSINVRYPVEIKQRSHSVFTLSSGNSESQRKAHTKKGEGKEIPRRTESPQPGPSRKEGFRSFHPSHLKFYDSSTQVNIKPEKPKDRDEPGKEMEKKIEMTMHPKGFPQFLLDPNGEIKYVCVCNDVLEDIPEIPDNFKIYKCSRLETKCIQSQDIPTCTKVMQCEHDAQTSIAETYTNHTKPKSVSGKDCGIFSKCSQTNIEYEDDSSKSNHSREVYWVHEGVRCIQTEISIDPRIPEPCLSDIKMISDTNCARLIYEQYRQKSKSSVNTEISKTVSSENSNALVAASSGNCARRLGLQELYRPPLLYYKQGIRQPVVFKGNVTEPPVGDPNMKLTVNVGTNADDLMNVKIASQAILTDHVHKQDNVTSLIEECTKGNQYEKLTESNTGQTIPPQDYVVNTLFTRELMKQLRIEPNKKQFLRSNTDINLLKRVETRNDLLNEILGLPKTSTDSTTGINQTKYQYMCHNTYPIVEDRHQITTIPSKTDRAGDADGGKFELHYDPDCDRATYHGVIEMKGTSKKCDECQELNCQGTCKKDAAPNNNKSILCSHKDSGKSSKSNKCTFTDAIDSNKCKSSNCKGTCGMNSVCKKHYPISYSDAICGTSDENIDFEKRKCSCSELEPCGRVCDEKAECKKPKGSLRFACGEDDSCSDANAGNLKKKPNVYIDTCLPKNNTTLKNNCLCSETADCKGTCDKNAECLRKESNVRKELCLSKETERDSTSNIKCLTSRNIETENVPRRGAINKTKCQCPETSDCRGSCGENAPCIEKSTVRGESSPVRNEFSSTGRATSPIGRASSPIGRATSPIGRTTSPISRASSPIGRATSPIPREIIPGRREHPYKSTSPGRRESNRKKDISSDNSQIGKNSGSSCYSEGMSKRRCVCSRNAKCGGYCAKTAKCMKPKSEALNKSPSLKPKTVNSNPIDTKVQVTGKGDQVETDSEKSDKSYQTSSKEKKSSCGFPASSECTGPCGNEPACAAEVNDAKLNTDSNIDNAQEDAKTLRNQTSKNFTEESEASSSKNLIKEMIQDVTRRYSKKSIYKSEKKKCYKEIMTLLNYLLDTEEESTDVDIARTVDISVSKEIMSKKKELIDSIHEKSMKTPNITDSSKSSSKKVNYSDSSSRDTRRSPSPHFSGSESRVTGRSTKSRQSSPSPVRSQSRSPLRSSAPTRNTSPVRSRHHNSDIEHKSYRDDKSELTCRKKSSTQNEVTGGCRKNIQQDKNTKIEREGSCSSNRRYRDASDSEKAACACRNNCGDKNCICERKKTVKDIGVQLDLKKRYRDWCTESSDVPFSTDLPSSDSATCKVLNKIKKECEKYQQRRCKFHNTKRCEISSSTSLSCEHCRRAHYWQWKTHRCKSCKKAEKKKNIGYNLFIQTSDSMISEEPSFSNPCRPLLKNIILKVPRNKKALGEKVPFQEITCSIHKQPPSPRGDGKTRSKSVPNAATVRDYLEQNRPDFIQQCLTRQKCLKMISESSCEDPSATPRLNMLVIHGPNDPCNRAMPISLCCRGTDPASQNEVPRFANERTSVRDMLSMQLDAQSTLKALSEADLRKLAQHFGIDPKYKTVPPKFISEREMKKHSENIYKTLPEVQRKKEEAKKERIKKTNLLLANIFNKNLQRKTLRGNVNISNYNTIVKI